MRKIASPQDLQAEIRRLLAYVATWLQAVDALGTLSPKVASRFGRGVTVEQLSKMLFDAAEHIYKSRGETRSLGFLLQECLEGQPFGEGPLVGASDGVIQRIKTAKEALHDWDFQGGMIASPLEAAGRDVKRVRTASTDEGQDEDEKDKPFPGAS